VLLAEFLCATSTLEEIELYACGFGTIGLAALGRALSVNTTLETLAINGLNGNIGFVNEEANEGFVAFARGFAKNTHFENLFLYRCGIGNKGATALGEALKTNKHLEQFELGANGSIGRAGLEALAGGLSWNTRIYILFLAVR
jgi:Ran GTPase-activating protein (RanGAP) involved in mRNA processing and transport